MKRIVILIFLFVLSIFIFVGCNDNNFTNPGDYLGGGGTGEIVEEVDDIKYKVKNNFVNKDFSKISLNTSINDANIVEESNDIYTISNEGTYYFKGNYGGILIGAKDLKLHLIFDNVNIITNEGIALDGATNKGNDVVITLIGENNIVSNSNSDNAIHIKGFLSFNGNGSLSIISNGKNAIKVSKDLIIVDCSLFLTASNHAISSLSLSAYNCNINVISAGKMA